MYVLIVWEENSHIQWHNPDGIFLHSQSRAPFEVQCIEHLQAVKSKNHLHISMVINKIMLFLILATLITMVVSAGESLLETAELMQIPNLLKQVASARQEYQQGEALTMEQVFG